MTPKTSALFAFGEAPNNKTSDLESVGTIFDLMKQKISQGQMNSKQDGPNTAKPPLFKNQLIKQIQNPISNQIQEPVISRPAAS